MYLVLIQQAVKFVDKIQQVKHSHVCLHNILNMQSQASGCEPYITVGEKTDRCLKTYISTIRW